VCRLKWARSSSARMRPRKPEAPVRRRDSGTGLYLFAFDYILHMLLELKNTKF
jgi:hypothetical protein